MTVHFELAGTAADVAELMARPGCIRFAVADLPADEYHRCAALSRSGVVKLMRSPLHFHAVEAPDPTLPPKEPTAQMGYGSLVHTLALQPHLFNEVYAVVDADDRRARAWKEAVAGNPGRDCVLQLDYQRALAQAQAIDTHPAFAEHSARGQCWREASCFWKDTVTGYWLMVRPDSMAVIGMPGSADYGIEVLDLKTTADCSPDGFARSCDHFRYDVQAAMYSAGVQIATGLPVTSFLIIASESEYPFVTEAYELESDWVGLASNESRAAIDRYAQCKAVGVWPGYSDGSVQLLRPPRWRAIEIERAAI